MQNEIFLNKNISLFKILCHKIHTKSHLTQCFFVLKGFDLFLSGKFESHRDTNKLKDFDY